MNIADNIIFEHLKHVYWIGGTACAGKTTIAKALTEEFGFYHYNADEMYKHYREMARPEAQPNMCIHFDSAKAYFERPKEDYIAYLEAINRESFGMLLVDLLKLPTDRPIIVEGHYLPELMLRVAAPERIALFTTSEELIRSDYFNREDKQNMLKAIRKATDSEDTMNHVLDVVVESAKQQIENGKPFNYVTFERTDESTVEGTLAEVCAHFGLNQ